MLFSLVIFFSFPYNRNFCQNNKVLTLIESRILKGYTNLEQDLNADPLRALPAFLTNLLDIKMFPHRQSIWLPFPLFRAILWVIGAVQR